MWSHGPVMRVMKPEVRSMLCVPSQELGQTNLYVVEECPAALPITPTMQLLMSQSSFMEALQTTRVVRDIPWK